MVLPIHQRESVTFLLPLSFGTGERHCELRPAVRPVCGCHASSVNPDNRLDESKPKSVPPRFASFDSSLEEVTTNFCIEARPVVFNCKCRHAFVCAKRNTNQARSG